MISSQFYSSCYTTFLTLRTSDRGGGILDRNLQPVARRLSWWDWAGGRFLFSIWCRFYSETTRNCAEQNGRAAEKCGESWMSRSKLCEIKYCPWPSFILSPRHYPFFRLPTLFVHFIVSVSRARISSIAYFCLSPSLCLSVYRSVCLSLPLRTLSPRLFRSCTCVTRLLNDLPRLSLTLLITSFLLFLLLLLFPLLFLFLLLLLPLLLIVIFATSTHNLRLLYPLLLSRFLRS